MTNSYLRKKRKEGSRVAACSHGNSKSLRLRRVIPEALVGMNGSSQRDIL